MDIYLKLDPPTANVTFLDITYSHGDVIRTDVGEYEAIQVKCPGDCSMTGSLVAASKPVAVFTVSDMIGSPDYPARDNFMEQLPPVEAYGRHFIVKQEPHRLKNTVCSYKPFYCNDLVLIVASEINTTVSVAIDSTVYNHHLDTAGQALMLVVEGDIMQILSDCAVLVIQVLRSIPGDDGGMLVVSPLEHYSSHDVIMFQPQTLSADKQVVVYTSDTPAPVIEVDGTARVFDGQINGPLFNVSYLVVNYTGGTSTSTDVRVSSFGRFGGYVSDIGDEEKITSLGHSRKQINAVSYLM